MLLLHISQMKIPNQRKLSLLYLSIFVLLRLISASPAPASPPSFSPGDDGGGDDYDYTPVPPPPPPAPCNPQDRNALLQIKTALNNSIILSSWIPGTDCCNRWEYVGCDDATGRVITLSFYGNGWGRNDLPRILPSAVGNLAYLENLNFYNNATGPVPRALARLQRLKFLYLSHNQFTGLIPQYLGRMQNLSWLELSGNRLGGPVPASLANAPSLYVLKLNNNMLTGRIPERLGHLKNINHNVITFDLSNNRLFGPIPRSLGGLDFRSLFLSGNRLTGDASFVFGKGKGVWQIELSGNKLSFNMSDVEIPPQLSWLGLSQNRIYGGLPPSLANVALFYLNVSHNHLCGRIPQGGSLQQFDETAYSHNKCLCGAPLTAC